MKVKQLNKILKYLIYKLIICKIIFESLKIIGLKGFINQKDIASTITSNFLKKII